MGGRPPVGTAPYSPTQPGAWKNRVKPPWGTMCLSWSICLELSTFICIISLISLVIWGRADPIIWAMKI